MNRQLATKTVNNPVSIKRFKHNIKLPANEPHSMEQNEAFVVLNENNRENKIYFHDYAEIYNHKGLYEQLFYERLKCVSPGKVCDILKNVLIQNHVEMSELRVLDVGAGNGMVGELLIKNGIARVVGVDILPEACLACERDRPGTYDAYYVVDLVTVDDDTKADIQSWHIDCMTTVAALGFHDIPPYAFAQAFNLVQTGGWIAFNIKETFLQVSDNSGFSTLVKDILMADILEIHHLERYRHRISIDGRPLYYYALVGKKERDIPLDGFNKYSNL